MMGSNDKPQDELFYAFNLDDVVPQDHLLRDIDQLLDFTELREHLAPYYSHTGRPSVDPELMIRIMLIGYCPGIRSDRLHPLAESGDGRAALHLSESLIYCKGVPENQQALDETLLQLYQTRTVPMTGLAVDWANDSDAVAMIADDADMDGYANVIKRQFTRCEGVTDSMKEEASKWIQASADSGYLGGMLKHAESLASEQPAEALTVYEDLWVRGYAPAAGNLARLYENGGNGLDPDLVKAYAYGYVFLELFGASGKATSFGTIDFKFSTCGLWQRYIFTSYEPGKKKIIVLSCVDVGSPVQFGVLV